MKDILPRKEITHFLKENQKLLTLTRDMRRKKEKTSCRKIILKKSWKNLENSSKSA